MESTLNVAPPPLRIPLLLINFDCLDEGFVKFSELNGKSVAELYQKLVEIKKDEFNGRIKLKVGEEVKPHTMRAYRKDAARVLTKINEIKSGGK